MHLKFMFPPISPPYNLTRVYFSVGIPLCADGGGGTKRYAKMI